MQEKTFSNIAYPTWWSKNDVVKMLDRIRWWLSIEYLQRQRFLLHIEIVIDWGLSVITCRCHKTGETYIIDNKSNPIECIWGLIFTLFTARNVRWSYKRRKEFSFKPDKTLRLDEVLNLTQNAYIKQQEGPWALNCSSESFSGEGDIYHKI